MNDLIKSGKKVFTFAVVLTTIVWSIGIGALALPLTANAVTSGDLIKGTGTAVYYYGADAKRYVFPYQAAYSSWYGSTFGAVTTMTDADLIAIPFGGNVTVQPGMLAQVVSMDTPWMVMDPKVYAVEKGGVLRWVKTADIAVAIFGATWESKIVAVPEALLTNYTIGAEINAAGDYNLATQEAVASINEDKGLTGVGGGALTVALASDTPAAASVPYGAADVMFTKVNFTAGAANVNITGLKVMRTGLGIDANLSAIKLFVDGVQRGTSQTLGSVHQATFALTSNPIVVSAGTTQAVYLAADIKTPITAFDQHILGIANATDITTTSTISGTFPINGNVMSLVNTAIGSATISGGPLNPGASSGDVGIDPAAEDFRFSQIRIAAGSTEGLVIDQISAIKNGTAANTDVKNIELFNDTAGASLGTVAGLDANGKAVFSNLNLTVAKGAYVELSIKADMAGGSGRTIGFDVHDGTSFSGMIKGATFNFGITPTFTNTTAFCDTGVTDYTCQRQTINQGYLTVSKSALAPATGKVPVGGTNVPLMAFDFVVAGEPVNVTSTIVTYTTVTGLRTEVTNFTLVTADGTILAGPKDGDTSHTSAGAETLTMTDGYTLPIGTTVVYAKANLATAMSAGDTVVVSMAVTAVTGKGANSGKTTYTTSAGPTVPPATAITGNTLTLQGPVLAIITAATPVAGSMVANAQDQIFSYIDLDASASGENIRVSSITVTHTNGGAGAANAELTNLELWGDPDNTDATAVNERLVTSNSTASNGDTVVFTFQTPIVVSKTSASRLTLKADVAGTGILGTETHLYNVNAGGDVTAIGAATGNTATKTVSGAGQAQTLRTSGTLKIEKAADIPSAVQLVSSSTANELMKYKFTTQYEPVDVTEMTLFCGNGTPGGADCTLGNVAKIYVYVDGVLVGSTSGYTLDANARASVTLDSGTLVIPKDSYKTVTLKVDLPEKTQITTSAGADLAIGIAAGTNNDDSWSGNGSYMLTATGQSSGATINKAKINNTLGATTVAATDADAVATTAIANQTAVAGQLATTAAAGTAFVADTDGAYIDADTSLTVTTGDTRVAVGDTAAKGLGYALGSVVVATDADAVAATVIALQTIETGLLKTDAAGAAFVFGTTGAYVDVDDSDTVSTGDIRVAAGSTAAKGLGFNAVYGSNSFSAHKGILTVSLNASSPSGTQTAGSEKEVLRLNLTATGDDVTIRELEMKNGGTAAITGTGSVTVKSDDLGTTYATVTGAQCDTYNAAAGADICLDPTATAAFNIGPTTATCGAASGTGDVCTGQWTSADNLQIAAGTTKVIRIFGDTTGALSTKTYQMTVSAAAANKVTVYGVTYRDSSNTDVGNRTGSADSTHPATKNLPLTGGSLSY